MKSRIVSVILSVPLTVTCVISFAYGEEQVDNNTVQDSSSYTILSHNQLGNTFHRMTSETITEDGISYLKLTPTTDALVPKIDKYGLNLDLSPYNYIKIRYKTTLENCSMLFDVMNATSFSTDLTFAVPQSDVWVSQILPIYTTNTSVIKQYHFSVFGNNNASALQGEEFCIEYIGFFDKYETALNYRNVETDIKAAPAGLGEDYVITGEDLAAEYASGEIFDPDGMLSFSSTAEADGSYKVTFQTRSDVGKIEFRTNTFSDYLVDKENNRFVAVRYKYDFAHPERSYKSTLREGFSEYSTNHELFDIPQNQNNEWLFQIAEVEWGTANEGDHIFTFHPIRGGDYAEQGDKFYIDYIGFFISEA